MTSRLKWFLAILLALGVVVVAQATFDETAYIPMNLSGYPITPTPTIVPGIYIIQIVYAPPDPMDEYVLLLSYLPEYTDLTGWILKDENGNECIFPRYTLLNGADVKVWTKSGQTDPDNIYCNLPEPIWNDHGDCAYLRDKDNDKVRSYCYGNMLRP